MNGWEQVTVAVVMVLVRAKVREQQEKLTHWGLCIHDSTWSINILRYPFDQRFDPLRIKKRTSSDDGIVLDLSI